MTERETLRMKHCPECGELQYVKFGPPNEDGDRPYYCEQCGMELGTEPTQ
jgi:hypothetical protein